MRADCLPHATVQVRINGEPLTEYQTTNEDMSATTYVEAISGSTFDILLTIELGFAYNIPGDRLEFRVTIDGQWARSNILTIHRQPIMTFAMAGTTETRDGRSTLNRFTFAEHASTDERADLSLIKKLASLGEIRVELIRCRESGPTFYGDFKKRFKDISEGGIPEKAMKGRSISNHATLGPTEVTAPVPTVIVTYPYDKKPIASYVFNYRSRRDLEIEGIIERPRSPTPPIPLEERDPDDLTPEELREQVRLLRARAADQVKIKQEFKREKRDRERSITRSDGGDGDITITSEGDRRKRARASAEGEEVIDLTDD